MRFILSLKISEIELFETYSGTDIGSDHNFFMIKLEVRRFMRNKKWA